jgi:DNA end-binding protein Ku
VREAKQFFDDIPNVKADADMIAIAEKIIAQKETDFDPSEFQDRYEDALRDLIAKKQKGHKIVRPEEPKDTNVVDLMSALQASLKQQGGRGRAPAAEKPKRAAAAATRRPPKKRAKR